MKSMPPMLVAAVRRTGSGQPHRARKRKMRLPTFMMITSYRLAALLRRNEIATRNIANNYREVWSILLNRRSLRVDQEPITDHQWGGDPAVVEGY